MSAKNYDAIVIGSGPGGMSAATLLQKRGKNVLLLEKGNLLGGKMISIEKDGYAYDLFPHGQVPMIGNQFEEIYKELGVYDEWEAALLPDDPREVITIAYRHKDWKEYRTVSQKQSLADPEPFFKLFNMNEEDQGKMLTIMTEMIEMTDEDLARVDNITMKDWLDARDTPHELYSYMAFHSNASLAEPIDLVSASEQIIILKQIFLQGGGGQYKGGFGLLTKIMCREFEKNGGTVIRNCKVDRINIENGFATGVETPEGIFNAPVVISSAGIQPTILTLAGGEQNFDKDYVNYIKALVPGWAFTSVRYFLDKPVMKTGMYVMYSDDSWLDVERYKKMHSGDVPDEVILFMCNHSFYDENAAPEGKQVLVSGTVCTADPDATEIQAIWDVMDKQMQETFPEIWAACERREYNGPKEIRDLTRDSAMPKVGGECVGLAQIVGQCGQYKPKSQTPINGLYIAGTDAGGEGMGTHQAALSGTRVADMAELYLRKAAKF